jgi:hypothetical protein
MKFRLIRVFVVSSSIFRTLKKGFLRSVGWLIEVVFLYLVMGRASMRSSLEMGASRSLSMERGT